MVNLFGKDVQAPQSEEKRSKGKHTQSKRKGHTEPSRGFISGLCRHCGNGSFNLKIVEHELWRTCTKCGQVRNIDKDKIIREGCI